MRICFVFIPERYNDASSDIPAIGNQGGKFPPMHFAYLASVLENKGHAVKIIDANALNLSVNNVTSEIKEFRPHLLGFSTGVVMFRETISWIRKIRSNINVPVVVGGDITTHYPNELFAHKEVDYGVIGYNEDILLNLTSSLQNKDNLGEISGLIYREKNKVIINYPKENRIKDLTRLPMPARHLLPNDKYYEFYTREPFTIVMASSGCACNCTFCFDKTDNLIERPIQDVIEEIKDCYYTHGIKEIDFRDRTFTANRDRVLQICSELKRNNLDIRWSCMTRIDLVDKEMLAAMKEAGCMHIKYGLESGAENILKDYNKHISLEKIKKNISLTKEAGIETYGFFMLGNKSETKETIKDTIKLAKELDLDYAHFQRYTIWPNRGDYNELKSALGYDLWREYITNNSFTIQKRNLCGQLSERELNIALKRCYLQFYFRPSYILKRLKNTYSLKVTLRSLSAALDIITNGHFIKGIELLRKRMTI